MPETITTTKENILKTHSEGCSATKRALESLYPEVFKEGWKDDPRNGMVIIDGGQPGIVCSNGKEFTIVYLDHGGWNRFDSYHKSTSRLIKSGTVTITIKNGVTIGAMVEED